jgi:tRNA 5-methylaminomethyl-2-thiouridine biosynthesis bifunctional protein
MHLPAPPSHAIVIGAGLAGAAAASSLARRGWTVDVVDAAAHPAAGASGLPVGLMAPHQSRDDNLLSHLTRAGIRITLAQASAMLGPADWGHTGTLEHRVGDTRPAPAWAIGHEDWTRGADAADVAAAGLPGDAQAWWHAMAAWIRPAALVRAWLATPGVRFLGGHAISGLRTHEADWHAVDTSGVPVATGCIAVVAASLATTSLTGGHLALHAVRGQVTWSHTGVPGLPPFPVNGHGHLIPNAMVDGQPAWVSGSTYGRGDARADVRIEDRSANLARLKVLVPGHAEAFTQCFASGDIRDWAGVRCVATDRRPVVGELAPRLWISTAMGSRGLTFAALCGELLGARLHGEPLPLEPRLAQALDAARLL